MAASFQREFFQDETNIILIEITSFDSFGLFFLFTFLIESFRHIGDRIWRTVFPLCQGD